MTKKWEEISKIKLLEAIQMASGLRVDLTKNLDAAKLLEGPSPVIRVIKIIAWYRFHWTRGFHDGGSSIY